MEKVLVEIFVPAINQSFDMFLPLKEPMYEVLELIKKAVGELSDGLFISNESTAIADRQDGSILNINMTVFELGIQNGSKLMLI